MKSIILKQKQIEVVSRNKGDGQLFEWKRWVLVDIDTTEEELSEPEEVEPQQERRAA